MCLKKMGAVIIYNNYITRQLIFFWIMYKLIAKDRNTMAAVCVVLFP